eukprot:2732355-Rhodomonas_salina.1
MQIRTIPVQTQYKLTANSVQMAAKSNANTHRPSTNSVQTQYKPSTNGCEIKCKRYECQHKYQNRHEYKRLIRPGQTSVQTAPQAQRKAFDFAAHAPPHAPKSRREIKSSELTT